MEKTDTRKRYEQRIYRVQDYISAHLDQDLNLEKLAAVSAFSPFHFHRIFKSVAGETLYDFIQRIRLEKACIMLTSDPGMKIISIAMSCGFSTASSFSKAFKQRFGITPSEYRNSKERNSKNGTSDRKPGREPIPPMGYISDKDLEILYHRRKNMNATIEKLPDYRIAYMRQIGPYGPGNVQLMQRLKKWAVTRDLLTESSIILGIAHDDPEVTPAENCRYDTCLVLSEDYALESSVNETRLPGGIYARFPVEHTAEAIGRAWEEIFSLWLPDSGYQIDDRPVFERYLGASVDLRIEPAACEICVPVKPV